MGLIFNGASARDLILDGRSVSLYAGGNPPIKVWPTGPKVVQITLGPGYEARDQFRAALSASGLDYATITEVPFEIELVGTGSTRNMFESCWALASAPVMDTSGVTDMSGMFSYCQTMTHVPDLDTSQVTNMSSMFESCSALTHAPNLDTSSVTNMQQMFFGCLSLTHVPDMDTSKVTNTSYMFFVCSLLTDSNVRLIGRNPEVNTDSMILYSGLTREPWYTAGGAPIDVYEVSFTGEYGRGKLIPLVNVTVPAGEEWAVRVQGEFTRTTNWSASKPEIRIGTAISIKYSQGEAVDFSGTVNSSDSTIAAVMNRSNSGDLTDFVGTVTIEQVAKITLGTDLEAHDQLRAALSARGLDYQTVTRIPFGIELVGSGSARNMFHSYSSLTTVPEMDTSQVTNMRAMFSGCSSLIYVPDMDTSRVTNMSSTFYGCSELTRVPDLLDTAQVTIMSWMFQDCSSLTYVPDMDTRRVTTMQSIFYNCSSLIHVPDLDTSQVTDTRWMFYGCSSLTAVPNLDTSGVTDMRSMFNQCSSLTAVPDLNTAQVTDMSFMFNRCYALTTVPEMDTSRVTNMSTMFQFCSALVSVPDIDTSQVTDAGWMFYGCSSLTDGNVRLIGRNSPVTTTSMITASGLTRMPFYDTAGNPI